MLSQTSNKQARGAKAVGEICSVEKEMKRDLKFAICKTPVQLLPFANAPLTRSHLIRRVFSFFSVMSLCDEFGIAFCGALHLPAPSGKKSDFCRDLRAHRRKIRTNRWP